MKNVCLTNPEEVVLDGDLKIVLSPYASAADSKQQLVGDVVVSVAHLAFHVNGGDPRTNAWLFPWKTCETVQLGSAKIPNPLAASTTPGPKKYTPNRPQRRGSILKIALSIRYQSHCSELSRTRCETPRPLAFQKCR